MSINNLHIPNQPIHYQNKQNELWDQCEKDLRYLISEVFNGHYKYREGENLIKIQSTLGTQCIQELKIDNDGEIKCTYLFWNGKELKWDNSLNWYNIPKTELIGVYTTLYGILFNQNEPHPSE